MSAGNVTAGKDHHHQSGSNRSSPEWPDGFATKHDISNDKHQEKCANKFNYVLIQFDTFPKSRGINAANLSQTIPVLPLNIPGADQDPAIDTQNLEISLPFE